MTAQLIESLPSLSRDELQDLVSRASFLLNPAGSGPTTPKALCGPMTAAGADPTGPQSDLQLVWDEIREAMQAKGESVPPLPVALRNKSVTTMLRRASSATLAIVRRQFRAEGDLEERKIVRLLVGLVVKDLHKRDKLILRIVLKRLETPERFLDRHFPSYMESGLLHLLVHRNRVVDDSGRAIASEI